MGMNDTPSGERVHIGFFGRRNTGKSSLVNAVTNQDLAVVSDTRGTTTDPVYKAMEILPMGPVQIIDTPGFDDEGELGELRVNKTKQVLGHTDVAVLVADCTEGLTASDHELIDLFKEREIPYVIAWNKCDLLTEVPEETEREIYVSARDGLGINELREKIARIEQSGEKQVQLVGDLIEPSDLLVLVIPIDSAAPKGRLILPQQQMIRDILDNHAMAVCVQESELTEVLGKLTEPPALVITDSQAFAQVAEDVPPEIPLTSFSILMSRYKGYLETAVLGVASIKDLKDGDRVLMAEGCTHHRQCDDIGTVKIPRWLREYTGSELIIETCSGREFPEDLSAYSLVIHCGGCMLNDREIHSRMMRAVEQGIPFTNYGTSIAFMNGILKRSLSLFPDLVAELEE